MRFLHPCCAFLPLLAVSLLGCPQDNVGNYGPPPSGCILDTGTCGAGSPGGGGMKDAGTGSDGGGTGGAQGASELTGSVARMETPDFTTVSPTPLTGAANIVIQPASGPQIMVPYGGMNPTTFDAMSVPAGLSWIYVQDQSGGASGIWSTVSAVNVPQLAPIVLPVVDQQLFTSVAAGLPSVQLKGVSTQAAHIVLLLQHQGAPYKGVQLTSGSAGATVVYDIGPGTYSDQATATSTGGTILLFNAGVTGLTTISLTDPALMKTYQVALFTATGAVTIAGFDLE